MENSNIENLIPKAYRDRDKYVFKLTAEGNNQRSIAFYCNSTAFDLKTGQNLFVKLVRGANTIFLKDLSEAEKSQAPVQLNFIYGRLEVDAKELGILNFLFTHDGFIGKEQRNPNNSPELYYLEDIEKDAQDSFNTLSERLKASNVAYNAPEGDIEVFAMVLGLTEHKNFWREKIVLYAEKNPKTFLKDFTSAPTKCLASIKLAFKESILNLDRNSYSVVWGNSGKVITSVPKDKLDDPSKMYDFLVNYFMSSEGKAAYDVLKRTIENRSQDSLFEIHENSNDTDNEQEAPKGRGRPPKSE